MSTSRRVLPSNAASSQRTLAAFTWPRRGRLPGPAAASRRRARGMSIATCCRCSAGISVRSRWTRSASGFRPARGRAFDRMWAQGALAVLDALEVPRAAVVGHHTGAAIAVEIAAAAPQRVSALVLSACPFVDAARAAPGARACGSSTMSRREGDGAHLTELWARRQPFYPADDTDLLRRFRIDALRAGEMAAEGHRVVNRYPDGGSSGAHHVPHAGHSPDRRSSRSSGGSQGCWSHRRQCPARALRRHGAAARSDAGGVFRAGARFCGHQRRKVLRRRGRSADPPVAPAVASSMISSTIRGTLHQRNDRRSASARIDACQLFKA